MIPSCGLSSRPDCASADRQIIYIIIRGITFTGTGSDTLTISAQNAMIILLSYIIFWVGRSLKQISVRAGRQVLLRRVLANTCKFKIEFSIGVMLIRAGDALKRVTRGSSKKFAWGQSPIAPTDGVSFLILKATTRRPGGR